jgi:hypothetical protein
MNEESLRQLPHLQKLGMPTDKALQMICEMAVHGPYWKWPMLDAVSRLRSHGIELTVGDLVAFAVMIKEISHHLILKADKSVTERERAILKTARKLRKLLGARTLSEQTQFEVVFMPIEHSKMRSLLNGVARSAVEIIREQAKANALRKAKGNRTDFQLYLYWLSLMEFWEDRLLKNVGYSTKFKTAERAGPLVEFIKCMSGNMPGGEPTNNKIGEFIKEHKKKRVLPLGYWAAAGDIARMTLILDH